MYYIKKYIVYYTEKYRLVREVIYYIKRSYHIFI